MVGGASISILWQVSARVLSSVMTKNKLRLLCDWQTLMILRSFRSELMAEKREAGFSGFGLTSNWFGLATEAALFF